VINKKLIASCIVCALIGVPTVTFAKARGGGGGFSGGSRGGGSGSMGSRGSRTYEQNAGKPIEQSTAPKPTAATPPPTTASPAPTAQSNPSVFQRHPILTGIAAGVAGSWIGHMLFGATDSTAKTSEEGEPGAASHASGFNMVDMLLLMLVAGGVLYYFSRRRTPAPVFAGMNRGTPPRGSLLDSSSIASSFGSSPPLRTAIVESEITAADKTAFQQLLIEIQTAWSKQDLAALRRFVTPEMLAYFSTALAEQASQEVENHVEDVALTKADLEESWTEEGTDYATAKLQWTARDYTVSTSKQPGQPGYLVEGSDQTPTDTTELWTFMRHQQGKWLLSAIQQVA
jgi:predicted lipid-binding transport protein (Tim44 family)